MNMKTKIGMSIGCLRLIGLSRCLSKPQLLQFARGLQKPAMRPRSSGSSVTVWIVAGMDLRKTAP